MTQKIFHSRRAKIQKLLGETGKRTALIISSNPPRQRSNDIKYPYRANSDLFYLSGTVAPDVTLVLTSEKTPPLLIGYPPNPVRDLWEGKHIKPKALATAIGAEYVQSSDHVATLQKIVSGYDAVHTQPIQGTISYQLGETLLKLNSTGNEKLPRTVSSTDPVLAKLRLYKVKEEIEAIQQASEVTGYALHSILPMVEPGSFEYEVASSLDYIFRVNQGEPAFETIVASGPSAATLHYHFHNRKLRAGEMLLIDCGAEIDMYAADITRTLPIGGKFSDVNRILYETVLEAQGAAIRKIRHGVKIREVYMAAADVLTRGLVDLKVLRGKVSSLMASAAYKPYFPHGIGHSLGLDVHDIGDLRGNNQATLEEGMVFTVEPGLYFAKAAGKLPPCGIRIEDDVLVTRTGCKNLTADAFPKEVDELESLLGA